MPFDRAFFAGRKRFIPFFVLGYPDRAGCLAAIQAALDAGADALELGIPFSDPIADGPTIQAAGRAVLEGGQTVDDAFALIRKIRAFTGAPIGVLVYVNLMAHRGLDRFCTEARAAGVDAVLAADVPVEEATPIVAAVERAGLGTVFLATPSTSDARLVQVAALSSAFVYVVSRLGVTGAHETLGEDTLPMLARLRPLTDRPLVVGFGLKTPAHVRAVLDAGADGAIVGSALVGTITAQVGDRAALVASVRGATAAYVAATHAASSP